MNILIDTNVLSEVRRPAPEPKVLAWLDRLDEDRAFISVASIAELRRGIALMEEGRRRAALSAWLADDLRARFAGRILPIDPAVAERWGESALVRLYRTAESEPGAAGDPRIQERALRAVLGIGSNEFGARWRAYVRKELG